MMIGITLIVLFLGWAIYLWHTAPPLISEAELESDEFGYCYTATPLRRLTVMLCSLAAFTLLYWVITYAMAYLIWFEVLGSLVNQNPVAKFIFFLLAAAAAIYISHLPVPKRLILDVCQFFQRHQFFPVLPSRKEGRLMDQIARLPLNRVPEEIRQLLHKDPTHDDPDAQGIYRAYFKLEIIHQELEELAKKRRGITRHLYFGQEWELIQSQFHFIDRAINANHSNLDETLVRKIHLCLYYSYGLLTRVIMETCSGNEESTRLFQHYGFQVEV